MAVVTGERPGLRPPDHVEVDGCRLVQLERGPSLRQLQEDELRVLGTGFVPAVLQMPRFVHDNRGELQLTSGLVPARDARAAKCTAVRVHEGACAPALFVEHRLSFSAER